MDRRGLKPPLTLEIAVVLLVLGAAFMLLCSAVATRESDSFAAQPTFLCRAQVGLNKGEAHHALKNAPRVGRQGEIRDRTTEGQHYRLAGLNLLTAIIVYSNTLHFGHAVEERRREGHDTPDHLLTHGSPLGWAHILLTGEYLWPKGTNA